MQAARHGKGHFLLMTFKEVFDNISAGERSQWGSGGGGRPRQLRRAAATLLHMQARQDSFTSTPENTLQPSCPPHCADASALREAYNDASYFKDEALRAFKLGVLSLEERAQASFLPSLGWGRACHLLLQFPCCTCGWNCARGWKQCIWEPSKNDERRWHPWSPK